MHALCATTSALNSPFSCEDSPIARQAPLLSTEMSRKTRVRRRLPPVSARNGEAAMNSPPEDLENDKYQKEEKLHEGHSIPGLESLHELEAQEGPEVGGFFRVLLGEGTLAPGDSELPIDHRPPWLDEEQLRAGQRFTQKYFCGLMLAEMLSLFLLFAMPGGLQPLIFSGNSDTPLKASRRYLSTVRRVRAWYTGDLWASEGEAGRHLRAVRHLHALYRRRLRDAAPAERQRRCALRPPLLGAGCADLLRRDFASAPHTLCPLARTITQNGEWLNQAEMSLTQWGFLGLMVTFPERFGAAGAAEAELQGFVHLWRVLGHLLGVRDRFNFCSGGLDAVRGRTRALLRHLMLPALAHAGAHWEHMARCVVDGGSLYGPPISFEVALLYLCETVGAETPSLLQSLSRPQLRQQRRLAWLMQWLLRAAPLRALFNWRLHRAIDGARLPPPEAQTEAEPKSAEEGAPRPSMWLMSVVFAFLTLVQIAIALVWASQPPRK